MKYGSTILALLGLLACGDPPEEVPEISTLDARSELIRLSVDLRGVHPTEAELQAAERSPLTYEMLADRWLQDPRLLERMREIFNQRYLTRTGNTYFDPGERGLDEVDERVLGDIIGEEPLQLLTYIIDNDLPYSTMVTADFTMANPYLARMWDIDYPDGATGWQPSHYSDGRPHAGILTMTTIWQRYPSMGGNANRHRANAISKMLLCDDYLSRPIVLNRAAVDQLTVDPENAIRTNASCQSCHATLDPLAANLFGFFTYEDDAGIEQTIYRPEMEGNWRYYSGKEPEFYGTPTANVVDMGELLAQDQRFMDCAVETVFEGLTQRELEDADWAEFQTHANAFAASDQNVKALVKSIVMSTEYRAGAVKDAEANDRIATVKVASPAQYASIVEGITGYRWTFGGRDGMTKPDLGLPVLFGGIDSSFVLTPNYVPGVGNVFIQERLAQAAGHAVAEHDLAADREGAARLLKYVSVADTPESNPEAFEAQIRDLYLQITGLPLADDAPEPQQLMDLWKYIYSVEASPVKAWGGVVSAVLRDPLVLTY